MKCSNKDATPKSKFRSTTSGDLWNCRPVFVSNEETALICWDPGGRRSAGWTPRHGSENRRQIKMRGMRSRLDVFEWGKLPVIYSVVYLRAFERRCGQRVINIAEKSGFLVYLGEETTSQTWTWHLKFPSSELLLSAHRHDSAYGLYLDKNHTTICLLLIHWRFLDIRNRYVVWYLTNL